MSDPDRAPDPAEPGPTAALDAPDGDGLAHGVAVRYFGDYEVRRELGRGGMSVVYEARQVSLNRPVALKLVRAGLLAGADELRRFQNEAEAVALLDHPGIVPVYEVGEHAGQRYFTMKLVPGGSLVPLLPRYGDDPRASARLVAEAAAAVAHAHARGILHRDLKPANILIDAEGHPHVTDFGLAKRVESDADLTQSGALLGTPAYMSPEQAAGRRGGITTAADVYGLGAVLYALLTGKAPFGGDSVVETLDAVRHHQPEPPTKLNGRVPRDLETIGLKCLEKDPRRRYPTAQALADDLRAWLVGEPIAARPAGVLERAAKWARRKPALATAYGLAVAVLLLSAFGGGLAYLWLKAERARGEAVTARDGAAQARATAERERAAAVMARDGEVKARRAAERDRATAMEARDELARARESLARVEYGRTIELAYQELRERNIPAAVDLLDRTRLDLRGWEYRFVRRLCHPELITLRGPSAQHSAAFSSDGSRVLTATGGAARLWDAKTGAELSRLASGRGDVRFAALSPDGTRIVTVNSDDTARVLDARSGAELLVIKAPASIGVSPVLCTAAFSPDGSRIVTANLDWTARVLDATTGVEILRLPLEHVGGGIPMSFEFWASFSPDGGGLSPRA